jgi:uncharacterized membrane protein YbhN (UPF0104 family)
LTPVSRGSSDLANVATTVLNDVQKAWRPTNVAEPDARDGAVLTGDRPAICVRSSGASRRRRVIVLVLLLASITAYLITRSEALAYLQRLSPLVLLTGLFWQLLAQLLSNGAMLVPLRTSLEKLGYWELFTVRSGGLLAGYVVPLAGSVAVRLTYLRRRGISYADFAWATGVSNLLALFSTAVLACCAVAALWIITGQLPAPVLGLAGGVLALGIGALLGVRWLPRLAGHRVLRRWPWAVGISRLRASRETVLAVTALSFGRHLFNFLTFGFLYQTLAPVPVNALSGGLVYAITSPLRMATITPGNLGVTEWVVAVIGRLLAFDVTTGLLVGLVFRGLSLAAQGLGVLLAAACLTFGRAGNAAPQPTEIR